MNATILLWVIRYRYAALLPLAIFQGSVFALVIGFLIKLGYLSALPAYGILILGDIIPDSGWYLLGRLGDKEKLVQKYGVRFKSISGSFSLMEKLWYDHPRKTMFFGKMAAGIATPVLISAGLVKMPYQRFMTLSLSCTLIIYALFLLIGYYLGNSYMLAVQYTEIAGYLIGAGFILICVIYFFASHYARYKLTKLDTEENNVEKKRDRE
jgi:membrane protein DedA with SNARE-associated domain